MQLRLDAAATAAIEAFHVCPSLDILVPTLIQHGAEQLHEHIALTPGMVGSPAVALAENLSCAIAISLTNSGKELKFVSSGVKCLEHYLDYFTTRWDCSCTQRVR